MKKFAAPAAILVVVLVVFFVIFNRKSHSKKNIEVVFYNVENLFDTIEDPTVWDDEFLPDSAKDWTQERYNKKLADLAKVLTEISEDDLPEVVGVCEVENRQVVEDLFRTDSLGKGKFKIIHEDSPDARGIDVALAYNSELLSELYHEKIRYSFPFEPETTTRDILYAKLLSCGDTLHFFVNHWPSRRGGQEQSEPKRLKAASVLRTKIDSILLRDMQAKIIAMGDFNDYPNNRSMTEVMNCEPGANQRLTNLTYQFHAGGLGTYNYRGEWGMLDQFIVSDGLLYSAEGCATSDSSATIFKEDWMMYFPEEGSPSPSKTYGGPNYYGGYSDHLPIRLTLFCN
ncbi:MAG: endonuclease/exonuclease/phosphatase family protein [Flavobacteriales bacterium]|nr:endonuclease/exonuclease/phosphatase family protein [Flavobacteriales bacterium]